MSLLLYLKSVMKMILPDDTIALLKSLYIRTRYLGNRFYCPVCDKSFRRFLPGGLSFPVIREKRIIGAGFDENLICPFCGSNDRYRLLYLYLKHKTNIFEKPLRVLHVAPEVPLQALFRKCEKLEYVSADINPMPGDIRMDITHIDMANEAFDVIICNHVLEHVPEDLRAIRELYRILRFGGWAMLQVPISFQLAQSYENPDVMTTEDREKEFGQGDHVRIYGRDYVKRLESVGFEVLQYNFFEEFGIEIATKCALNVEERIFICRKNTRA